MVASDFNIILYKHEKKGGGLLKLGSMEDFTNMMIDCQLDDAEFVGNKFTWEGNKAF